MKRSWFPARLVFCAVSLGMLGSCDTLPLDPRDAGPGCEYGGSHRAPGSTFASDDGCNTCACGSNGQVACSARACPPDGGGVVGTGSTPRACGSGAPTDGTPGWIAFDSDRADFNRDIYTIRPNGSQLTRLTTEPGMDKEPAISPDGNWMTFTSDRGGSLQIYLMDLTRRTVTALTNLAAGADQSSFSHDGNLVTFRSGGAIYTIHRDGTAMNLVTFRPGDLGTYSWPHFSVDDRELAVDRSNEIDAAHLDGTGFRMIVQNWTTIIKAPSVSPNGIELVYHTYCSSPGPVADGSSLWITPYSTTTNPCAGRRLTPASQADSQRPAWGPNDVFAYERVNKATNVAAISLISRTAGSVPCILMPGLADNRNPAWSP